MIDYFHITGNILQIKSNYSKKSHLKKATAMALRLADQMHL